MAFARLSRHFLPVHLETILILLWTTSLIFALALANNETVSRNEPSKSKKDVKLAVVLRRNTTRPLPLQAPFTETPAVAPAHQIRQPIVSRNERNVTSKTSEKKKRRRGGKSVETSFPTKVGGVDKEGASDPEEFIRTALINHTLEHGGEEDLDKLVFSSLPQGSKLILRTVRIIRTDENGDPVDDEEDAQPTYWDVTLANATDTVLDEEEEDEGGGEDDAEEEEENEANKKRKSRGGRIRSSDSKGRKKSDLESSGSHAAANYHHLNDYATTGGEKARGKSHYHGNNHGNSHKHAYTETDGKNVKPYHGEGKGGGDYANEQEASNKDHGERFKTSKRKNKGRKVTGFKRVYHKEEFQRTEHFFDDEEANKIAESFGLSEKKEASNHGSKGDKRKYHGVDSEYLDGKEKKNEHGTHSGYDKGQHSTYKDSEKHGHHGNYGKGSPQHYGSSLPNSHQNHNHGDSYQYHHQDHGTPDHDHGQLQHSSIPPEHPNHNYHVSYSNDSPPQTSAISGETGRDVGRALYSHISHIPAIIPAPVAHEFSVTELSPIVANSATASDPNVMSVYSNSHQRYPTSYDSGTSHQSFNDTSEGGESEESQRQGRKGRIRGRGRWRKEPNEKRTFFSPKHRNVNADPNFEPSPIDVTPFSILETPASHNAQDGGYDNQGQLNVPYTVHNNNLDIPLQLLNPGKLLPPPPPHAGGLIYPKPPRWPRRRPRPKATLAPGVEMHLAPEVSMNRLNQVHLSEIPLRHALAYHKLGNRLRYQPPTLLQPNSDRHPPLYEVSTRKSDVEDSDFNYLDKGNETADSPINNENDSAHYLNHNTRYAKDYLTSTMQPPDGVRNTILGPQPGVYSTIIKVLPATMMKVNDSASNNKYSTITASGSSVSVSARPVSAADSISITTEAPQVSQQSLQQQQQLQLQQYRPFLPLPRQRPPWMTLNLNHPNNIAQNPHLYYPQGQRPTNLVQEIRNGLLRPFRGPRPPPPPTLLPAPTMTAAAGGQTLQLQKIPTMQIPVQVPYRRRHPLSRLNLFGRYHSPPPRSHYYNPLGRLPQNNMGLSTAVVPPELFPASPFNLKPKFYYNHFYTPVNISNASSSSTSTTDASAKSTTEKTTVDSTSTSVPIAQDSNSGASSMTSTVVAAAAPKSITLTTSTSSSANMKDANRRKEPMTPNFFNGLMDSVSGFFGRVG